MIVQLRGTVVTAGATQFVIECAGVGYGCHTTPGTAASLRPGEEATVHTSLVVREDSQTLFGFGSPEERDAFEMVQAASGVGPRLALSIISVLPVQDLRDAILTEDLSRLVSVPGIGKKSAQKIVIELKDKVLSLDAPAGGSAPALTPTASAWREQVSEGLQSLGWSARDAEAACDAIAPQAEGEANIAVLMRAALGSLSRP